MLLAPEKLLAPHYRHFLEMQALRTHRLPATCIFVPASCAASLTLRYLHSPRREWFDLWKKQFCYLHVIARELDQYYALRLSKCSYHKTIGGNIRILVTEANFQKLRTILKNTDESPPSQNFYLENVATPNLSKSQTSAKCQWEDQRHWPRA